MTPPVPAEGRTREEADLCRVCAYLNGPSWCDHDAGTVELATALAAHFQDTTSPTMEQTSWFIDDAYSVAEDAGPGPWTFRRVAALGSWDEAVVINDTLFCGMRGDEGHVLLEPVCRTTSEAPS